MTSLRRLTHDDLTRLCLFWVEHWGGEELVIHGEVFRPEQLDGFVVEEGDRWVGLFTFFVSNNGCEVTSLDSLREGQALEQN